MTVLIVFGDAVAGLVIGPSISSSAVVNPVVSAAITLLVLFPGAGLAEEARALGGISNNALTLYLY